MTDTAINTPTTYTEASDLLKAALLVVAGACDGARALDGQGFNGFDTQFGKSLAWWDGDYTEKQIMGAWKLANKYKGQHGIEIPEVLPMGTLKELIENRRSKKAKATAPAKISGQISLHTPGTFTNVVVSFDYNPELVQRCRDIKAKAKFARFDNSTKSWNFSIEVLDLILTTFPEFDVASDVEAFIEKNSELAEKRRAAVEAEEAKKTLIAENASKLREAASDLFRSLPDGRVLFQHQIEGVEFVFDSPYGAALLAFDMGLGKTLTGLTAAKAYEEAMGTRTIIVAPVSMTAEWEAEARKLGLTNFSVHSLSHAGIPKAPKGPFVFIGDEVHKFQTLNTKRTKAFMALTSAANCVAQILLTGTPVKNGQPKNIFPLLRSANHPVARNKKQFDIRFCDGHQVTLPKFIKTKKGEVKQVSFWDNSGATNLDELHEEIDDFCLRRTKDECLDLPPKRRIMRAAELTETEVENFAAKARQTMGAYAAKIEAKEAIAGTEHLVGLTGLRVAASLAKVASAVEMAEEVIEEGRPVVLFTAYRESGQALVDALTKNGHEVAFLHGGITSTDARYDMTQAFQRGEYDAFVGTIGAAGVGITLTAASTSIMVDRAWTPGDTFQAEDRIYRIGQDNPVEVYWLQLTGFDEKIDLLLQSKEEISNKILTGEATGIEVEAATSFNEELRDVIAEIAEKYR